MDLLTAKFKLAKALRLACSDHGRPNSFSCKELESFYNGPPKMVSGRIGSKDGRRVALWIHLGGSKEWGSCPRYEQGRFYV